MESAYRVGTHDCYDFSPAETKVFLEICQGLPAIPMRIWVSFTLARHVGPPLDSLQSRLESLLKWMPGAVSAACLEDDFPGCRDPAI